MAYAELELGSLLDEVCASLCAARWRARSWTWAAPTLLDEVYVFLRGGSSRRRRACAELELDGSCYHPLGRGLRLPSRRQVTCAGLELEGSYHHPVGRGLRLPSRRRVACAELELDCNC